MPDDDGNVHLALVRSVKRCVRTGIAAGFSTARIGADLGAAIAEIESAVPVGERLLLWQLACRAIHDTMAELNR